MKHKKFGFTLVEVSLFLAISGLLFVAIIAGTRNSIWQQRYNDAVQSYVDFLRNVYAEVSNPQSLGDGRSDLALYGKLITFGQSVGLDGNSLNGRQRIFVYDVVGKADVSSAGSCVGGGEVKITGPIAEVLKKLCANVVVRSGTAYALAGVASGYSPIWGSVVESSNDGVISGDEYRGSILVVRHPGSSTIMTLHSNEIISVNEEVLSGTDVGLYNKLGIDGDFSMDGEVDFCLNPYGAGETGPLNRDIRIIENAHNASGVELIDLDSDDNRCRARE